MREERGERNGRVTIYIGVWDVLPEGGLKTKVQGKEVIKG